MEPLVNHLRDDLERALGRVVACPELIQAANRSSLTRKVAAEDTAQRWPILSAWKWFVPLSTEIEDFGHDDESSSRTVTSSELGHDLAYRGIMPRELGRFLRRHGQSNCTRLPEKDAPDEQFGSFLDMQGAADELVATAERCVRAVGAAIGVLRLLMLGLRCIRAEYLKRLDAWASAMTASLSEATAQVLPAGPLDRARTWLRTPEGGTFLRELRWLAADRSTAVNRLRSVLRTNHSNDRLAEILMEFGIPLRTGTVLSWGASQASWAVYRQALQHVCRCPVVAPCHLLHAASAVEGPSQQVRRNRTHAPGAEGWTFLRRMLSHHPLPRQLPLEPRRTFSLQGASRGSRTTLPRLSLAVDSLVQRLSLRSAAFHSAEYQQPHGQGCSYLPAWSWLRQHTGCTEPQAEYIPLLG